ncbi:MAG: response regulator [Candidatus Hodarchaeales archaeon]|jgi:DNA-binding response OmpR family regulator/DNA-binding transcriptional ArsR family regulator
MRIIIADDNTTFLETLSKILLLDQHEISTATSAEEALKLIMKEDFDLLLTDLKMGGLSGIDLIKEINKKGIDLISLVITGYGSIDSAVEAMKTGAYDYILKPFEVSPLREKIEEIQEELRLRNTFSFSPLANKQRLPDYSIESTLDEYEQPFLVISNEDPQKIINEYKIENASNFRLGFTKGANEIPPTKLHLLQHQIEEFIRTNDKGTIIFKGIEELYQVHNWSHFKGFIDEISKQILASNLSLIFLIDEKNHENAVYQSLIHDTLSLLSIHTFNSIISLISHPLRKDIINLLKSHNKLNFNKILEELQVKSSSSFAFHLKKLVEENILEKDDSLYYLTSRGNYFAEIIFILEKIGFIDPGSKIKIFNHIRRTTKFDPSKES